MVAAANLVEVAALVGDTARATMLAALMGGQSLTATELAYCANVSRSTASGHLSKLVAARLLTVTRKRRFSYYRIASPLVATMLESIKVVAAIEVPPRHHRDGDCRRASLAFPSRAPPLSCPPAASRRPGLSIIRQHATTMFFPLVNPHRCRRAARVSSRALEPAGNLDPRPSNRLLA